MIERVLDSAADSQVLYANQETTGQSTSFARFTFDPNTVTQKQLIELGFSVKTAAVFMKFRNKGFVFKQKSDLKKVYGVSDKFYAQLEPYISIEKINSAQKDSTRSEVKPSPSIAVKAVETKFELNSVDSTGLISISGIGNTFAKRILKYRSLLGGYVAIEQLKEVYGFNDELYTKVKGNFTVNATLVKKINLNTDEFKVINKHPYISYEICKIIFDWRKKTSITASNLNDILKDDVLYQKLLPYLKFE
jgi:DNA uptake protein ComE-like DNA-binding protein